MRVRRGKTGREVKVKVRERKALERNLSDKLKEVYGRGVLMDRQFDGSFYVLISNRGLIGDR